MRVFFLLPSDKSQKEEEDPPPPTAFGRGPLPLPLAGRGLSYMPDREEVLTMKRLALFGAMLGSALATVAAIPASAQVAPPPARTTAPPVATAIRPRSILFVGNSFTQGAHSAVKRYRADAVTDLNGDGYGGVPALFKTFTEEVGAQLYGQPGDAGRQAARLPLGRAARSWSTGRGMSSCCRNSARSIATNRAIATDYRTYARCSPRCSRKPIRGVESC